MPRTDRIKKTLTDTRPFYAVAGASDLAMEKLRPRLTALRGDLEPKALQHRVRDRVDTLRHDVQALPEKAAETYDQRRARQEHRRPHPPTEADGGLRRADGEGGARRTTDAPHRAQAHGPDHRSAGDLTTGEGARARVRERPAAT